MSANSQMYKFPNKEEIEVFYIGELAHELGRSSATIRKWEISGIIPDPLFTDSRGCRLYTQEQIDAIVKCAVRAKVKQGYAISNTSFSVWVHKELAVLKEKYLILGGYTK